MTETSGGKPLQMPPLRFSIVIANFNYARFIDRAIESALGLDWPNKEVIVVDDGSSDGSRSVIEAYGNRITAIFQENSGQRVANNAGFALSTGDVVVFLDADDILEPGFARAVANVWRDGVSKVQVQMMRVDVNERPLGRLVPDLRQAPSPADIRAWVTHSTEYPTPPGSGNAYARSFLDRFFPIGPEHDNFTDSTCLVLAPLLGDVVTVLEPLVLYRMHGNNDSNLLVSEDRFGREVARAILRQESAIAICERLGVSSPAVERLRRSRHLLQLRIASLRLRPGGHPLSKDGRLTALGDAAVSLFTNRFDSAAKRMMVAAWSAATLVAPLPLARRLIRRRFRQA